MDSEERDNVFGRNLRQLTGATKSKSEAFTWVRTFICNLEDWNMILLLIATSLHLDGPNDHRVKYRHTGIFSFLCTWNNKIYRMTLIVYTRASCGNWMERNFIARSLRSKLQDHSTEHNGRKNYSDLVLLDNFQCPVVSNSVVSNSSNISSNFIPSRTYISVGYTARYQNSRWSREEDYSSTNLEWSVLEKLGGLSIIVVPEFPNRFGYVSCFACQINRFIKRHTPTQVQKLELLYIALLSTSPVTFYFVMQNMIQCEVSELQSVSLFCLYIEICVENDLIPNAGRYSRYQPQPYATSMKMLYDDDKLLSKNLVKLNHALDTLNEGNFLNAQSELRNKPNGTGPEALHCVGTVCATSFASLAVFTGLATSTAAIDTAKMSNPNPKAKYYEPMRKYVTDCYSAAHPEKDLVELDTHHFILAWKSIAKSLGELVCTLENWSCATFRSKHKCDVFFKGETLYNLVDTRNSVQVKLYGCTDWTEIIYD